MGLGWTSVPSESAALCFSSCDLRVLLQQTCLLPVWLKSGTLCEPVTVVTEQPSDPHPISGWLRPRAQRRSFGAVTVNEHQISFQEAARSAGPWL